MMNHEPSISTVLHHDDKIFTVDTNDLTIGWQNLNPLSTPQGNISATSRASKGQVLKF